MVQLRIDVRGLPDSPLDAAAEFLVRIVPQVRSDAAADTAADIAVIFDSADHTHDDWRLATIRQLARDAAPQRVNAATGPDGAALDDVLAYLAHAPGVTGQILIVDAIVGASA